MASFTTLYSGSSGNCTLIRDGGSCVLVDMGRSCKSTLAALYAQGVSAGDITAIVVTHEHVDHISGLNTFLKHYPTPVYGSQGTLAYLRGHDLVPANAPLQAVQPGQAYRAGALVFSPFRTSHDSADCMGYRFELSDGRCVGVATDLGYVSDEVMDALCGCVLVALESNYDDNMLLSGRYPYHLKSRIRSHMGHLSNDDCAAAAAHLAQAGARHLVLMHLSQDNNLPDIARMTCESALENYGCTDLCRVMVAPRFETGETIQL